MNKEEIDKLTLADIKWLLAESIIKREKYRIQKIQIGSIILETLNRFYSI